jgi:hypothetical protein
MNWFIEGMALTVWFYGDLTIKVLFLIWMIYRCHKGFKLPKPHRWFTQKLCEYRSKRWNCQNCLHIGTFSVWQETPRDHPCYDCTVPKRCLWRKPSGWEAETGRDGLIA